MKFLLRATDWIDSKPVLLFGVVIFSFAVLITLWVAVMGLKEGEASWKVLPFLGIWSWAVWSMLRTMREKKKARIAELERLASTLRSTIRIGSTVKEAVVAARSHLGVDGNTRYRSYGDDTESAEFHIGSRLVRIYARDGRVTTFEVS